MLGAGSCNVKHWRQSVAKGEKRKRKAAPEQTGWIGSNNCGLLVSHRVKQEHVEDFEDPNIPDTMIVQDPVFSPCHSKGLKSTGGSDLKAYVLA